MQFRRKGVAAVVVAAALAVLTTTVASATPRSVHKQEARTRITMMIGGINKIIYATATLAKNLGYYEKAGVDVYRGAPARADRRRHHVTADDRRAAREGAGEDSRRSAGQRAVEEGVRRHVPVDLRVHAQRLRQDAQGRRAEARQLDGLDAEVDQHAHAGADRGEAADRLLQRRPEHLRPGLGAEQELLLDDRDHAEGRAEDAV